MLERSTSSENIKVVPDGPDKYLTILDGTVLYLSILSWTKINK